MTLTSTARREGSSFGRGKTFHRCYCVLWRPPSVRARLGRLRTPSVLHSINRLYGGSVWAGRALSGRFLTRRKNERTGLMFSRILENLKDGF
jgi:hypothetical protein